MTGRRSMTIRSHVSQIGKRAGLVVPGIRRIVTETCTGQSQTADRLAELARTPRILRTPGLVAVGTLVLFGSMLVTIARGAAPGPRVWSSAQASDVLTNRASRIGVVSLTSTPGHRLVGGIVSEWVAAQSAKCRGLGRATKGAFSAFECSANFKPRPQSLLSGAVVLRVRPWSTSSACIARDTLVECPPPPPARPLRNDPRRCDVSSAVCMNSDAAVITVTALRAKGSPITTGSVDCVPITTFSYSCDALRSNHPADGSDPISTVTWTHDAAAWKATLKLLR